MLLAAPLFWGKFHYLLRTCLMRKLGETFCPGIRLCRLNELLQGICALLFDVRHSFPLFHSYC